MIVLYNLHRTGQTTSTSSRIWKWVSGAPWVELLKLKWLCQSLWHNTRKLKPLVSSGMCCVRLGKLARSWAAFCHQRRTVNFQQWRKIMWTATDISRGYLILKLLVPLRVVSSQREKRCLRMIFLTSPRSSDLSVTIGDGRNLAHVVFWHLHILSDKLNITTVLAPKLKLTWACYQGAHVFCFCSHRGANQDTEEVL